MSGPAYKNHPATRLAHYLFLLPFVPALQPLMVNLRTVDMVVYLGGAALVIFIVIYGNQRPLVRVESNRLCLYLHYRHNAEYHPFSGITGFRKLSSTRVSIRSRGHQPVTLRLKKQDINSLIGILEEENINAVEI